MMGFIFDFDGVILDSMEVHFKCLSHACEEVGMTLDKRDFYRLAGTPTPGHVAHSARGSGKNVDIAAVCARYDDLFLECHEEMDVVKPVFALVQSLHAAGFKTAIASSSPRKFVLPFVERFGVMVDAIVTIDDVTVGKPDPEIFLEAAARLGVSPVNCVVFEDSDIGIEAARRAGMATLRYTEAKVAAN